MKKLNKLLISGLALLSVVGCSKNANETLTCSYSLDQSMLKVEQELTVTVEDGVFKTAKLENELIYNDEYIGKYDENTLITSLEEEFDKYETVTVTATDKGAIVVVELDTNEFAEMSDVDKEDLSNIKEDDMPEIREELEEAGYICK